MAEFFNEKLPKDTTDIYLCGDWHIGDTFHDGNAVTKMIKYLNGHPDGVLFIMGDLGRYFPLKDRLSSTEDFVRSDYPTPASQLAEAERIIQEIDRTKWSYLHIGNHEQHIFRQAGNLYTADYGGPSFCNRLSLKYAGFLAFTKLKWADNTELNMLTTHGKSTVPHTSRTRPGMTERYGANASIALRDILGSLDRGASDFYAMGHAHKLIKWEPPWVQQLYSTGDELSERRVREAYVHKPIWACCTGSLCKSFPKLTVTYQEEAMHGPCDIGMVHVRVEKEDGRRIPVIELVDLS